MKTFAERRKSFQYRFTSLPWAFLLPGASQLHDGRLNGGKMLRRAFPEFLVSLQFKRRCARRACSFCLVFGVVWKGLCAGVFANVYCKVYSPFNAEKKFFQLRPFFFKNADKIGL